MSARKRRFTGDRVNSVPPTPPKNQNSKGIHSGASCLNLKALQGKMTRKV